MPQIPSRCTKEEIKKLFDEVKGTDLELAIYILVFLGLRRGELMALRWSHIDFEKRTVNIIENAVTVGNRVVIKDPKSESGKREIKIPNSLMMILRKAFAEYRLRKNMYEDIEDFIIVKEDGTPYNPNSFSEKFKKFLSKSDLKTIRLHDLRHTSATLLLQAGVAPKVAQKILGHADFSTTMDIYSHVLEDMEQEAADKLDEVLSDTKPKKKYS